jgi:zinc transport system substrate-binding protein
VQALIRLSALMAAAALAACGTASARAPHGAGGRLDVAVSVPPQAYFVEKIGGPHVRVEVMIPPGYSHVDYAVSPRQMAALAGSTLYVKVGHPAFEYETHYIDPFLARHPSIQVVDMSRGMHLLAGEGSEGWHERGEDEEGHDHAAGDPHVWVAPDTVRVAARNIAEALERADPGHAADYARNLRSFEGEIDALDREIRARLSPLGGEAKFMVYHPSWSYFAHEYGLEQIAIEAEGKEPSAQRLIQLIDRGRRDHVQVVFVQGGFPRKSAQVIADAVGGRVLTADPQEKDWEGNLRRLAAELAEAYHG